MRGTQAQPVFQHQEGRVKGGDAGVGMALSREKRRGDEQGPRVVGIARSSQVLEPIAKRVLTRQHARLCQVMRHLDPAPGLDAARAFGRDAQAHSASQSPKRWDKVARITWSCHLSAETPCAL